MKKKTVKKIPTAKEITLTFPVTVYSEHSNNDPDIAKVTFSPELIKRIRKLSEVVKQNDATYIAIYDYTPDLFNREDEELDTTEWGGATECQMLIVKDTDFYWKGLIKHTDWNWETEACTFKYLDEILTIAALPIGNMPTYMNDEDEDVRELAKKRMREGK